MYLYSSTILTLNRVIVLGHMKRIWFLILVLFSCSSPESTKQDQVSTGDAETEAMVEELRQLVINGNPRVYYHWNNRLADLYKSQIELAPNNQKINIWFQYCAQLLNAGKQDQVINEIEQFLKDRNLTYEELLNPDTKLLLELLALAYLRKGEIDNCQINHNAFSCIVPLQEPAFHADKVGSQGAIRIYSLLQEKFPSEKYKWLIHLAQMTLGTNPNEVQEPFSLPYPNSAMEDLNFTAFNEVAMDLGLAQNGLSGGVIADDFNQDGWLDLFMTSYGMKDQCNLFINTGSSFENKTQEAGLSGIVSGLNCVQADYDNDGDIDILVLRGGWLDSGGNHPNSLLQNDGNGHFKDVTRSAGLYSLHPTQTAAWADVNRDGYLDLFIGNESKGPNSHPCELYINQQDGTFLEAAAEYGLGDLLSYVKGVSFGDINNDKWPDLYISSLTGMNKLFINQNGSFVDGSDQAGVGAPVFSFPCWFFDINNDGLEDIFVSSYDLKNQYDIAGDYARELLGKAPKGEESKLYINNGNGSFEDRSMSYGLNKSFYTMGCNYGDLDNDGWKDFYLGTGAPDFSTIVPNRMFRNLDGQGFSEVTSAGRFGHIQKGHGITFADFDRDGDQDIYAVMGGAFEGDVFTNVLFDNPLNQNDWLVICLEGVQTNRFGVGSKIKVTLDSGRTIWHTISSGASFGANPMQASIGLGPEATIASVEVFWQNGTDQSYSGIKKNGRYLLKEGSAAAEQLDYSSTQFEKGSHQHHH